MIVEYPIAVSILLSYFIFIGALVWRISPQLKQSFNNASHSFNIIIFLVLAAISFLATWTYMFKFFIYSYQNWRAIASYKYKMEDMTWLNSISYWLHEVSLFDSAWRQVCVGAWQWLWSHQLCTLTVAVWTPILAIEGSRRRIPYVWAYMLLGQVVAISVASGLFFAVMLCYQPVVNKHPSDKVLKSLACSTIGGIITVIISPYVATGTGFMPNLLVMHILLILPLASRCKLIELPTFNNSIKTPLYISTLYTLAAGANFAIYINQWLECLSTLEIRSNSILDDVFYMIYSTFFGHPAQSSISSDIICMKIITMTWIYTQTKTTTVSTSNNKWAYYLIAFTPIFSASVTLPLYFAITEYKKLNILSSK